MTFKYIVFSAKYILCCFSHMVYSFMPMYDIKESVYIFLKLFFKIVYNYSYLLEFIRVKINILFNLLTFWEWCILRRTLWTSGLLSKVEVWLDGGCEYSEVFSSSEANAPCILPGVVSLDLRNLHPGPIGLLAILYNIRGNCIFSIWLNYLFLEVKI